MQGYPRLWQDGMSGGCSTSAQCTPYATSGSELTALTTPIRFSASTMTALGENDSFASFPPRDIPYLAECPVRVRMQSGLGAAFNSNWSL